mgnify:CR=1 FL=1
MAGDTLQSSQLTLEESLEIALRAIGSDVTKAVADNPWDGLAQLTGSFASGQINNRVADAESAGQASAAEALAKLGPQATQGGTELYVRDPVACCS